MFLFRKPEVAVTPQEKREELLREFIWGNPDYTIKFDQEDMEMRKTFLTKVIAGGWLGVAAIGMGLYNFHFVKKSFPKNPQLKWFVLCSFWSTGSMMMASYYFKAKFESQEYLRKKYLSGSEPSQEESSSSSN